MRTLLAAGGSKRDLVAPALVVLAGGALRLTHFLGLQQAFLFRRPFLDAGHYHRWAVEIAGGDWAGVQRGVFDMSPGYPYFVAVLYSLFGVDVQVVVLAQFLLGLACGWMIYLLGSRHLSRGAGLIGAALYLSYPLELFFESTVLKASLLNTVNVGALLAAATPHPAGWLLGGLLTGFSAQLRPTVLLAAPCIAGWLWWRPQHGRRAVALFVGGVLAVLAPVAARNLLVGGAWVWTTAHGGMNFYTGNCPESRGPYEPLPFARTDTAGEQQAFLAEARRRSGQELTPAQASRFWYAEAWRFMRRDPAREAGLLLKKAVVSLNGYEAPINIDFNFFRGQLGPVLRLPLLSFALLLPLAALGLARAAPSLLLGGYLGAVFLANLVFLPSSEYRFPAVPVLCLYAGQAVASAVRDLRARAFRRLVLSAGAFLLLAAGTSFDVYARLLDLPGFKNEVTAASWYDLGLEYQDAGRLEEARDAYRESIKLRPGDAVTRNNLGVVLARLGRLEEAIGHFEKALPSSPDARYNLGRALALTGRHREAPERFRQAGATRGRAPEQ